MCDSLIISLFLIHSFTSLLLIIGFSWWNESVLDISDNIASIYLWYAFSLSICFVNMHMQFSCICTLLCVCAFNKHLHIYAIINWYFYAYAFIYNITSTHWYNKKISLVDILGRMFNGESRGRQTGWIAVSPGCKFYGHDLLTPTPIPANTFRMKAKLRSLSEVVAPRHKPWWILHEILQWAKLLIILRSLLVLTSPDLDRRVKVDSRSVSSIPHSLSQT